MDGVIVAQKLDQVLLLLQSLNDLIHQVLQALMVGDDGERMAEEVVSPFANRRGDGMELPDVSGGALQPQAKSLAKKYAIG